MCTPKTFPLDTNRLPQAADEAEGAVEGAMEEAAALEDQEDKQGKEQVMKKARSQFPRLHTKNTDVLHLSMSRARRSRS